MRKISLGKTQDLDRLVKLENDCMSRFFLEEDLPKPYPIADALEDKKIRLIEERGSLLAFLSLGHDLRKTLFPEAKTSRPFYDFLEVLGNPSAPTSVIECFAYDLDYGPGGLSELFKDEERNRKGDDFFLLLSKEMKSLLPIWAELGFQNLGREWKEGENNPYLLYKPFIPSGLCRNIGW